MSYRPVALIILDGWGIREMEHGNAVVLGNTPNYDRWLRTQERSVLDASGEEVGLPRGQMGNSEVGHLNLGAGRIVYQDITRIDKKIREGGLAEMPALSQTFSYLQQTQGKLHLIGLLGPGGVHAHSRHLSALLHVAKQQAIDPILHIITDGRDTPPCSAADFIAQLESEISSLGIGTIASVGGRYYTMDRDKRWPRTELGYKVIAQHIGESFTSASQAIAHAHANGITDEFIVPVIVQTEREVRVTSGDALLFYNFRADRMRQLVQSFAYPEFNGFTCDYIPNLRLVTMTQYDPTYPVNIIFPPQDLNNPLAEVLSKLGLKQLHAAETEKYAHVTYFFNGGLETPFAGEERILIPSPKVATYDLKPEMSAYELRDAILQRLTTHEDDFVLVNFANPDMVGHTGVLSAAIKAVEAVDECAGTLVAAINQKGGVAIVTADHGNCERMIDEKTGIPHTYHTTSPVSLFVIGQKYFMLHPRGILADVAPTILALMGIPQPPEMSGQSLIE